MALYRVWAKVTDYCYLDVEATSESEAVAIAEEADGGDFSTSYSQGDWEILYDEVERLE